MASEDEDFQFINYNPPPDPPCCEEVNGKITCDLTGYDPPTHFPSKICSKRNLQVLKLIIDDFEIPKEIGNLHKLEHLVLCQCDNDINLETRITKIPTTLRNLKNLKVLNLRNNPLYMFPSQLTELFNLEELHVSNCQLANLPDSFAKLQLLKTLDLSNNLFKDLPSCIMKLCNLCKLYVADGCLQNICGEIKNLVNLERLQLTSNELMSLPEGLFELVNLKKLYLNNNKLTSLHDKVGKLVNLEYLVLNQNKLTKIPETIGKLKELRYLNLHENMLSCLPESVTSLEQIETLLVDHNPLQVPPVHVCNQGIESVRNYFKAMKNTKNIHAKRLKVVVLGESMAGKTSLVNALMTGESTQIDEDDRTFGVVFYHWKPEPEVDELELMVVDCAGQKKYQMTHQLFLSEGALFILAVDLFRYGFDSPESYQENVGQWISLVAARIPRARILVVPTHIDECHYEEDIDLKVRNILVNMKEQREEMVSEIDKKIKHVKKTEGHCIPSEELAKILEQHREQKDNLPVMSLQYKVVNYDNFNDSLAMNVTPVSNKFLELGMVGLRRELVRIARNKNLSPNIDINLPESWVNIEQAIKKCRKTGNIPCLSIAELQEVLKEQGIDVSECELHSCVSYLDAIGELQYFKGIHGLVKNVVINPYWFGLLLKKIFRHDMKEKLTFDESVRKLNIVPFRFEQDKEELLNNGVMTQVLLRCVWSEFLKKSDTIFPQLLMMLTHFGFACEMPAVGNDLYTADGGPPPPCYLIPWFFSPQRPRSMRNNWPPRANARQVEVTAGFTISQYLPPGVFMRFSVLCHRHEPDEYDHWQNGFYMKFDDVVIHSSVLLTHKCGTLKVAARAPKNQRDTLWRILLILLQEIIMLLKEWPGLNYVPFTVCPHCIKNGTAQPHHFTCNWFNVHQSSKRRATCKTDGSSHEVQLDLLFPSKDVLNEYRKSVVIHLNEIPDCILKDDLLDEIADQLGTRWPRLARKLDLSASVGSIKEDHRGDTHEQAVEMLTNWKLRLGKDAKIEIIVEALREISFNGIADFIVSRYQAVVPVENSTKCFQMKLIRSLLTIENKDPISDIPEYSFSVIEGSRQTFDNSITIDQEGGCFKLPIARAFLIFPPQAVDEQVTLTYSRVRHKECEVKRRDGEVFVSRILKMGPADVMFKKPVTVLLSHSAYENQVLLDFYELLVVNLSPIGCQELKTERISSIEDAPKEISNKDILNDCLPFAKATIHETCTLVVVTRVKSDQISIPTNKSYAFSKQYGENAELKITFPAGVTKEILNLTVQLFPADAVLNKDIRLNKSLVYAPIIRVSGQTTPFLKAVYVELTYSHSDVVNIEEEFVPVGKTIHFTTEYGLLLRSHKETESITKWLNLNESNDVCIKRSRKDQLKFSFSVERFSDVEPVTKTRAVSSVPPTNSHRMEVNNPACHCAIVLAVHDTGSSPTKLQAVLAPKDALEDVKRKWKVEKEIRKFDDPVKSGELIYICVPLSDTHHLPLEDHTLRFNSDPEIESVLDNNTDDDIDLRGKYMRFLKDRECINGENHNTEGDCRAKAPVHIAETRSVQVNNDNEPVNETSSTIAPKPEVGVSSAQGVAHNGPLTSQTKDIRDNKRLCKEFEKEIENIFPKKLGINKDQIQNPDVGATAMAVDDAGTVTSVLLGLCVGATIALSIGSFGIGSIVASTIAGATFTFTKVDEKMKKSKAKKLDKKVEIYIHSHLNCIIMDVAKESSCMFEYQVVELKDRTQINILAQCAVDLMMSEWTRDDIFDRNTLIKKVLQDGKIAKKRLQTKNGDKWSAPDVFRKCGLQQTIVETDRTEFMYKVKPNDACDIKKYGYRGQFLELTTYVSRDEEDRKVPEIPAKDKIHTPVNSNYEHCTSGQYFCESAIDSQYSESREENRRYRPIHILVQSPMVLNSFIGSQLSLANFLRKKLCLFEYNLVYPVYRPHSPGKVPDLQNSDLTGSDFSHCDFTNSSLEDCVFVNCVMLFAKLGGAKMSRSKFCDTLISHSNLEKVKADHCEWTKTSLLYSRVDEAYFGYVIPSIGGNCLVGTNFCDAITGKERKLNCNEKVGHCEEASTSNSCDDDEIELQEKMRKLNCCETPV